jgi:ubiquilin
MSFSVNVKMSGAGETFAIAIENATTVAEMKEKCNGHNGELEVARITLVYKGRILKDDQTVETIKLSEGQTIHLVNKPAKKEAPKAAPASDPQAAAPATGADANAPGAGANPFGGMAGFPGMPNMTSGGGASGMGGMNMDPGAIAGMMNNPMMQGMMENMMQNPEMLNNMINNNP